MFSRILSRTMLAIRANLLWYIIIAGLLVALSIYMTVGRSATSDITCADSAMAIFQSHDDASIHQAWQCLSPAMQVGSTEQTFSSEVKANPPADQVTRVARFTSPDHSMTISDYEIVYNGRAVNMAVYVDQSGQVAHIE